MQQMRPVRRPVRRPVWRCAAGRAPAASGCRPASPCAGSGWPRRGLQPDEMALSAWRESRSAGALASHAQVLPAKFQPAVVAPAACCRVHRAPASGRRTAARASAGQAQNKLHNARSCVGAGAHHQLHAIAAKDGFAVFDGQPVHVKVQGLHTQQWSGGRLF